MVFPVHLQRSAVAAILDCPVWRQYTGPETLKPVALQLIWLFQEPLISNPLHVIQQLSGFCGLTPSDEQISAAQQVVTMNI